MRLGKEELNSLISIGSLYERGIKPPYTKKQVAEEMKRIGLSKTNFGVKYPTLGVLVRRAAKDGLVGLVRRRGELYIYPGEYIVENPDCIRQDELQGPDASVCLDLDEKRRYDEGGYGALEEYRRARGV